MSGLAGADAQSDREVSFAGPWWAEEHDVLLASDEVQRAQVGDLFTFEGTLVVEVELLQRFSGREPGSADAALTAVGLSGGDFALQARREKLLMGPGLCAGPFDQPGDGIGQ